jgi:hypothetical protein
MAMGFEQTETARAEKIVLPHDKRRRNLTRLLMPFAPWQ